MAFVDPEGGCARARRIPKGFGKGLSAVRTKLEDRMDLTMTAFFTADLVKANEALDAQKALESTIAELEFAIPGISAIVAGTTARRAPCTAPS